MSLVLAPAALLCTALAVYHEARGESLKSQEAVAHVVNNRAKQQNKSTCAIVKAKGQFPWHGKKGKPQAKDAAWRKAQQVAKHAARQRDPTQGATHFHHVKVKPDWSRKMQRTGKIGSHTYYRTRK